MRCVSCRERAVHHHHVLYQQWAWELPEGVSIDDPANLAPVCLRCHERHHSATQRLPRSVLPAESVSFALRNGMGHRLDRIYPEEAT